jgi:tRNA modification GTPase
VDTAGLRETSDTVERMGIEASHRYLEQAAVVLVCGDSANTLAATAAAVRARTGAMVVTVATKADLVSEGHEYDADVAVSALSGRGLRDLLETIQVRLSQSHGATTIDAPALTLARHQAAVARAASELRAFAEAWQTEALPASVAAIHVRSAGEALEDLIGVVQTDDVLDAVFRRFCVGK